MLGACYYNDATRFMIENLNVKNVNDIIYIKNTLGSVKNDVQLLKHILDLGANTNLFINEGRLLSPLIRSTIQKNVEMILLLLQHGAIIDLCDYNDHTPLHHAIRDEYKKCADVLIHYGADIRKVDLPIPGWVTEMVAARELRRHAAIILLGIHRFGRCDFYGNGKDVMRLISKRVRFGIEN
jgi:hypothetical protein